MVGTVYIMGNWQTLQILVVPYQQHQRTGCLVYGHIYHSFTIVSLRKGILRLKM